MPRKSSQRIPRPPIPEGHHFCTGCLTVKPVAEFCRNRTTPNGLAKWCRACLKRNEDDWKRANPERARTRAAYHQRRKRYGSNLLSVPIGAKSGELKAAAKERAA